METRNFLNKVIYHIPHKEKSGFASGTYDHEYLVHGTVWGNEYNSILLSDIIALGVGELIPMGDLGFLLGHMPDLVPKKEKIPDLTMEEVQVAKRVPRDLEWSLKSRLWLRCSVMSRGNGRGGTVCIMNGRDECYNNKG